MKSSTFGCPSTVEVLIHCHAFPVVHPRAHAPAVKEGLRLLEQHGLIEPRPNVPGSYRTTDKGKAKMEQLCQVRL